MDRDGVLIRNRVDYVKTVGEVVVIKGAFQSIAKLHKSGYKLIVVTNQSAIGRGLLSESTLQRIHRKIANGLAEEGIPLEGVYYCPHTPDEGCACRKPKPGMLLQAAQDHHLSLKDSWMIGDKPSDIEAGRAAGCRTIRVRTDDGESLQRAVQLILVESQARLDFLRPNSP